jgi:ribosomal protein S18 acetylase RimI-like enzyme
MLLIRPLRREDCQIISNAFTAIGWAKPVEQYERYLARQEAGERPVFVAEASPRAGAYSTGEPRGLVFAGYVCVVWESGYRYFREAGIPEIVDLNVLPQFRRRRIASSLMDAAEAAIVEHVLAEKPEGPVIAGIGVGMYPDYGPAQRMYVRRGYVPDGHGLAYDGRILPPMEATVNDDSLNLHFTRTLVSTR